MDVKQSDSIRILVLGLGNTLFEDEGLGVAALHRLARDYNWSADVTLLDGGVMGLELLPYLESAEAVLILDAVQTAAPPGSLVRLVGDEIPAVLSLKLSVHQIGLQETLAMCQFRGTTPSNLVLWGVVPHRLGVRVGLTHAVSEALDALVQAAVMELEAWGLEPSPRQDAQAVRETLVGRALPLQR
jgi:hydrogenase maturation protease